MKQRTVAVIAAFLIFVGGFVILSDKEVEVIGNSENSVPDNPKNKNEAQVTAVTSRSSSESAKDKAGIVLSQHDPNLTIPKPQNYRTTPGSMGIAQGAQSAGIVDETKVQNVVDALHVGTEDEQIEAISILARVGTDQQKETIRAIALDPDRPTTVRLTALENLNWDKEVDAITTLVQNDASGAQAAIYMAASKDLDPQAREAMDAAVRDYFLASTGDPSKQLAALNYFFEQRGDVFDELVSQADPAHYTKEEREDIDNLIKLRNEQLNDN